MCGWGGGGEVVSVVGRSWSGLTHPSDNDNDNNNNNFRVFKGAIQSKSNAEPTFLSSGTWVTTPSVVCIEMNEMTSQIIYTPRLKSDYVFVCVS